MKETLAFIIIVAISISVPLAFYYGSAYTVEITIKEKWIKQSSWIEGAQQMYMFSDTDNNVYKITDEWLYLRWDASNRWAIVEEGKTYRITFVGWRFPFFSWYQNAVSIEEL